MLLSDLATVRAAKIVLASGSPRRVDMFNGLLKLNARVVPSTFPTLSLTPTLTLTPTPTHANANPHTSRAALSFYLRRCSPRSS